jgi:hypothetical protein
LPIPLFLRDGLRGGVGRMGSLGGLSPRGSVAVFTFNFDLETIGSRNNGALAVSCFVGAGLTLRGGVERICSLRGLVFVPTCVCCFTLLALSGFFFGGDVDPLCDSFFLGGGDDPPFLLGRTSGGGSRTGLTSACRNVVVGFTAGGNGNRL